MIKQAPLRRRRGPIASVSCAPSSDGAPEFAGHQNCRIGPRPSETVGKHRQHPVEREEAARQPARGARLAGVTIEAVKIEGGKPGAVRCGEKGCGGPRRFLLQASASRIGVCESRSGYRHRPCATPRPRDGAAELFRTSHRAASDPQITAGAGPCSERDLGVPTPEEYPRALSHERRD